MRDPRSMSRVPAVRNVIGVRRSCTMSLSSSASMRTRAAPSSPGLMRISPGSTAMVHAPAAVWIVMGRTPNSIAPGMARSPPRRCQLGEPVIEELRGIDRGDVVV